MRSLHVTTTILVTAMLGVVAVQALTAPVIIPPPRPQQDAPCKGIPIVVDYPYGGGLMQPHECAIQCDDGKPRYISYDNGKATQCEVPPGCSDAGEDNGITCIPPDAN